MTRTVFALTGPDRVNFLNGLITNDVAHASGSITYAALLTPQGKYVADFFVINQPDRLLVDVESTLAPMLAQRLTMYRLRAQVTIAQTDLIVSCGTGPAPENALPDPRDPAMGWRHYGDSDLSDDTDWDTLRVAHVIPATGIELTTESYILEAGFERLHGVDFRKGCFVGQEIVARMKHKTELRKGLVQVSLEGHADPGTEITSDGKPAGTLHTVAGDHAIAFLRFDRAEGTLRAGSAVVKIVR
jgi:folate-binding protein YgfZ